MSKVFRPYQPDQILMLPPSLQEWLPADHEVYFVADLTETLDLGMIYGSYQEERGYPPYHPLLMVRVWLYAYMRGIRSARKVARATREDIGFRVLCAGNEPDFRTLADFRKRHIDAIEDLFLQVLKLCQEAGLVKLGHVAIDGTKVRANASKHKAMSYDRMLEDEKRLRQQIRDMLAESDAIDAEEDAKHGADRHGDELPVELAHRKSRLKKIREARQALEAEVRAAAEASGSGSVKPDAKDQRSFTDPESRIMPSSDKGAFLQGYNGQLAVDAAHQIIVAADVVQATNDKQQMIPMMEAVIDNCGEIPDACSGDAGYWSEATVESLESCGIDAFIAPERISHREWREAKSPRGRIPEGMTTKDRMRRKLRTKAGRAQYDKRKITAEPVCGQLKTVQGIRQFMLRGLRKVRGEWLLASTAHNALKLHRAINAGLCYT
ncbi:MAG TPA: IS1182 family transposase [Longimicrobiales bacterium]|nr:IS1182 family transposase [Longimicrobiales bacterium]